ncbi:hypothetical protein AVEN_249037-1 [Araneus ventricosus]|uniref:Uncharacterized protein n=1 Tax=Araneus ventricosus TaxID=182803 RepID=A0A4Y2TF96_ARAVE|nr:hypothetical protein AVEN_249037-1 [Araneus ventricosus]
MSSAAWTDPDIGDFGYKTKILRNARIFEISLIGAEIQILQRFPCDVKPCQDDYKYTTVCVVWECLRGITEVTSPERAECY